jgi:hypothetical protein
VALSLSLPPSLPQEASLGKGEHEDKAAMARGGGRRPSRMPLLLYRPPPPFLSSNYFVLVICFKLNEKSNSVSVAIGQICSNIPQFLSFQIACEDSVEHNFGLFFIAN